MKDRCWFLNELIRTKINSDLPFHKHRLSDMILSEFGQMETTSVSFVADLHIPSWDGAIISPGVCHEPEAWFLCHFCFEEHRHGVIVIRSIAVFVILCDQYIILVELEYGAVVLAGFMGSEVGHEVEHLTIGNGELVH